MENWSKVELLFSEKLGISPLELDEFAFYRLENLLEAYNKNVEEQNKAQEAEQAKMQKENQIPNPANPATGYKLPKVEVPTFNIPKYNLPKY